MHIDIALLKCSKLPPPMHTYTQHPPTGIHCCKLGKLLKNVQSFAKERKAVQQLEQTFPWPRRPVAELFLTRPDFFQADLEGPVRRSVSPLLLSYSPPTAAHCLIPIWPRGRHCACAPGRSPRSLPSLNFFSGIFRSSSTHFSFILTLSSLNSSELPPSACCYRHFLLVFVMPVRV